MIYRPYGTYALLCVLLQTCRPYWAMVCLVHLDIDISSLRDLCLTMLFATDMSSLRDLFPRVYSCYRHFVPTELRHLVLFDTDLCPLVCFDLLCGQYRAV